MCENDSGTNGSVIYCAFVEFVEYRSGCRICGVYNIFCYIYVDIVMDVHDSIFSAASKISSPRELGFIWFKWQGGVVVVIE